MAGKRYDSEEVRLMATLRDGGLSIPAVARRLGRTPAGIQGALRARGWVDASRSKTMRSVHIFSPGQRELFQTFLCARAARSTPTDIRDEWNKQAATTGWPVINNERVIYYLKKFRLLKKKAEYMQCESYRLKQGIAQRQRRVREQAARLRILQSRRAEVYTQEPDVDRRKCQLCRETWPLTKDFFRNAGSSDDYFLNTCKMCYPDLNGTAADRRKQRMDAYDRHVIVKQISLAKAERDAFLRQHRNFPTRRCSRCYETWELRPNRFPKYRPAKGDERYRRTCRFCLRAGARRIERTKSLPERFLAPNFECDPAA
jgi:hypothetical protein